jgi:hypothetical protein
MEQTIGVQSTRSATRLSRPRIDLIIAKKAAKQLGLVTALQLSAYGITEEHLERRARNGALHREVRTVYRVPSHLPTLFQFILSRCFAIPESVIGGFSAAMVHGLPVKQSSILNRQTALDAAARSPLKVRSNMGSSSLRGSYVPVELQVGPCRSAQLPGAKIRRVEHQPKAVAWNGGLVTTAPETLLDLARFVDRPTLSRCLDYAIVEQLATVQALHALVANRPRAVNRHMLLGLLHERPTGAVRFRSRLEQTVNGWLDDAQVGPFVPNYRVPGIGVETDFAWVRQSVALEVSPFYTHGSEAKQARDMERRQRLLAAGWIVIECTDCHLTSAAAFAPIIASLREQLSAR